MGWDNATGTWEMGNTGSEERKDRKEKKPRRYLISSCCVKGSSGCPVYNTQVLYGTLPYPVSPRMHGHRLMGIISIEGGRQDRTRRPQLKLAKTDKEKSPTSLTDLSLDLDANCGIIWITVGGAKYVKSQLSR